MNSLGILVPIVCILSAIAMQAYCLRRKRRDAESMRAMENKRLYRSLRRHVEECVRRPVDKIYIESTGVSVTAALPVKTLLIYRFHRCGSPCRAEDAARIIALLLERDFPMLQCRWDYTFRRYAILRDNGRREFGYMFSMTNACKSRLYRRAERVENRVAV